MSKTARGWRALACAPRQHPAILPWPSCLSGWRTGDHSRVPVRQRLAAGWCERM